jgi:DNA-binding transcriptional ArsR family regulator
MATYEFGLDDLTRLRFAISPMWEVVASLRRLRAPSGAGIHLPWLNQLQDSGALQGIDLAAALTLTPTVGYVPDFMSPPPTTPLARFEDEIELVRRTPPKQVAHDLRLYRGARKLPSVLEPFESQPRKAVRQLADVLELYWQRALEPHWPRMRALLQADIAHRARSLTEGGAAALFADLHPTISWRESEATLHVDLPYQGHVVLGGQGLLLVPSVFAWVAPATITEAPWQPTLLYPARGIATIWESGGERTPEALANVVGRTRAALLAALDAPRSTTDVARLVGITAGGASQHLGALRAAGLVAGRREGRAVLYVRTPLADALVGAGGKEQE